MYATKDFDPDSDTFNEEIAQMDAGRDILFKEKNLAVFDRDSAIICKSGPVENAKFSCNKTCIAKDTPKEIIILDEDTTFQINFNEDVVQGRVNSVSWEDIDEASDNDKTLKTLRNALKIMMKKRLKKKLLD